MMKENSFERGPYLSSAVLCEKVLVEQDGVKSAIRIIDRLIRTVSGPEPPEQMEPFDHELTLLVIIKSGWARGAFPFKVVLVKPSGESPAPFQQTIYLEGEEDRGVDVIVNLRIRFDLAGIYWFEIYLSNTCLTRIPLRIIYMPQIRRIHGTSESPPPVQ